LDLARFSIEGQNFGSFLVINYIKNLKLSKYVNDDSSSPILFFFNEKEIRNIWSIFDLEK
jgi:hypothetical protein